MKSPSSVAVIGAGIAGLSCATALHARGIEVQVFDKGRGVGGRTSTRRVDADPARGWDHGAICFLAEDPRFIAAVEAWAHEGLVAPWPFPEHPAKGEPGSWVGVPGMNAIARHLAARLDIQVGKKVDSLVPQGAAWKLRIAEAETSDVFDAVVLTAPAPQSHALIEAHAPELAEMLMTTWFQPCWSLLAYSERVEHPVALRRVGPGQLPDGVSSLVCEDTKPGRVQEPHASRWLLQSTAGWAKQHLEDEPEQVVPLLSAMLAEAIQAPVLEAKAHRWRYARVHRARGEDCIVDAERGLALAGDFCRGDGLENAWLSGRAAAEALMTTQGPSSAKD